MLKFFKKYWIIILFVMIFVIGLLIFLYPFISNFINERLQTKEVSEYDVKIQKLTNDEYNLMIRKAQEYNNLLLSGTLEENTEKADERGYYDLLSLDDSGIMGYLTIDKIKVELPIYHTVSETVLNSSVGHLEGTSLPIGGKGTHSVLSAHRGLPSAKLFTELDKLEIGDTFKITILDETHVYKVDKISIVKPNDRNELKINKDNDYITLLTCTPYGINTHRLLVRGGRIQGDIKKDYITTEGFKVNRLIVMPIIALPIIALLLIVLLIKPVKRVNINKYEKYLYPNGKDFHGGKI